MPLSDELIAKRALIETIAEGLISQRELRVLLGSADRGTLRVRYTEHIFFL